jgi:hypothetical protein
MTDAQLIDEIERNEVSCVIDGWRTYCAGMVINGRF